MREGRQERQRRTLMLLTFLQGSAVVVADRKALKKAPRHSRKKEEPL